jgi:hypothetical protein
MFARPFIGSIHALKRRDAAKIATEERWSPRAGSATDDAAA